MLDKKWKGKSNIMKKFARLSLLALLTFGTMSTTVACGDKIQYSDHVMTIAVSGSATVGQKITLIATIDNSPLADQKSVTYSCSDAEAFTFAGNELTCNKEGTFTVNAEIVLEGEKLKTIASVEITVAGATTIADVKAASQGEAIVVSGVVTSFVGGVANNEYSANGFYLSDTTGSIYVFGYKVANQVQRLQEVTISATVASYNGTLQLASPELVEVLNENVEMPDPSAYVIEGKTVTDIYNTPATEAIAGNTYKVNCKITTYGTTYMNYEIIDAAGTFINIYSSASDIKCPENAWLDEYNDGTFYDVAFYVNSMSKKGKWRGNIVYIWPNA